MKLLHYTNRNLFTVTCALMALWGVFFYYAIVDEVMDETDDALVDTAGRLVSRLLTYPELLNDTTAGWPKQFIVRRMTRQEARRFEERFYDAEIYLETEDEYEPIRVMSSCFRGADGGFYELKVWQSTLERDDMVEAIVTYLVILFVALLLCMTFSTRLILKSVFRPLNRLVAWVEGIEPGKPTPDFPTSCKVREFRTLGRALTEMHRRGESAYEQQTQFLGNVSHELQTPLAVVQGKLELLADMQTVDDKQLQYIDQAFHHLNRAVQLNKTLLMLSRIDNGQYIDRVDVSLQEVVADTHEMLAEVYASRQIVFDMDVTASPTVSMNEALARVLVGNLMKNAVVHSAPGDHVRVCLSATTLTVANDGDTALDERLIFTRFYHSNTNHKESVGLGLNLADSIARHYGFVLSYAFEEGRHTFTLKFVN